MIDGLPLCEQSRRWSAIGKERLTNIKTAIHKRGAQQRESVGPQPPQNNEKHQETRNRDTEVDCRVRDG